MGYRDFSGCGPVHLLGGTCSLFGAAFLGPRLGRFANKCEDCQELPGHSVPVSVTRILLRVLLGRFMTQKLSSVQKSFVRDRENASIHRTELIRNEFREYTSSLWLRIP
jgi:hypothetical protein